MKKHKDPEFLQDAVANGKNSRDIGREVGVSWKLVEIYLRQFGIAHTPYKNDG